MPAGWTGHDFCHAAEILRYTDFGWQQEDIRQFQHMLLTVRYPLIKDVFPEANGNWDGALIDTMLCTGICIERTTDSLQASTTVDVNGRP